MSFCFQTPYSVSLLQLICCPDMKLPGKACLSSYAVESCWEKCGLMDSGWRGEHLGACRGINVYVLVALETEDMALMLATCKVLKNPRQAPQTSNCCDEKWSFWAEGISRPCDQVVWLNTPSSHGAIEEGRRHIDTSFLLPLTTAYLLSLFCVFT